MCGIFGLTVGKESKFTGYRFREVTEKLFLLSELRSKEASALLCRIQVRFECAKSEAVPSLMAAESLLCECRAERIVAWHR